MEFKEEVKKIIFNLALQRNADPEAIYETEKCLRWEIERLAHDAYEKGLEDAANHISRQWVKNQSAEQLSLQILSLKRPAGGEK